MNFWSGWPMPPDTYHWAQRWPAWAGPAIAAGLLAIYWLVEPLTREQK